MGKSRKAPPPKKEQQLPVEQGWISAVYADRCRVWFEGGDYVCSLRGRLKRQWVPVVGDQVYFQPQADGTGAVDYPDFAHAVAKLVASGRCDSGVVVDGAGIGSCMAANKVPGVLAATCHDARTAANSREHNGANVLCLGSVGLSEAGLQSIVEAWLQTPTGGGRHARRVDKIRALEGSFLRS